MTNRLEKMLEEDKKQHFIYSFFILLACFLVMTLLWSVIVTALIGLAKEIWDHYYGSGFCWWDLLANALGMIAGVMLISVVLMFLPLI